MDIRIINGGVSKDHVHLHVRYPTKLSESEIMRRIKGRTGKKLMEEFPHLHKRYWGQHFWSLGYGAWSTGTLTQERIDVYMDQHGSEPNGSDKFILE